MPMVKVWNDNTYPHKERFKEALIEIPAGGFVMMDKIEAHEFKGAYTPMAPKDEPNPERFHKRIRIELVKDVAVTTTIKCPACAVECLDQASLDKHTDENHLDLITDKEVANTRRGKRGAA